MPTGDDFLYAFNINVGNKIQGNKIKFSEIKEFNIVRWNVYSYDIVLGIKTNNIDFNKLLNKIKYIRTNSGRYYRSYIKTFRIISDGVVFFQGYAKRVSKKEVEYGID